MKLLLNLLVVVAILTACQSKKETQNTNPNMHEVIVKEAMQAGTYTYLKVEEQGAEKWLAVPAMNPEIGKTYYFEGGMEMLNFQSKELKRTFDKVYFVDVISAEPIVAKEEAMQSHGTPKIAKKTITVTPIAGGITIAELFKNKNKYSGKSVKITGEVTKFNEAIMETNWIHLQDGTDNNGEFDLTVTSKMVTKVGDIITVEGKIVLDKDLGSGYFYNVIMEDAVFIK